MEEEAWDTYIMRILPWAALWYTLGYRIPNDFPDMDTNMKGEIGPLVSSVVPAGSNKCPFALYACSESCLHRLRMVQWF